MASDDTRDQGDEQVESEQGGQDASTPVAIATTDPVIDSVVEHQSDWKTHPDSTVSVETSQVSEPNLLYAPGVRTVVIESHTQHDPGRSGGEGRRGPSDEDQGRHPNRDHQRHREDTGQDEEDDQDQGRGHSQPSRHDGGGQQKQSNHHQPSMMKTIKQPSMMRNLLITVGVALLGGLIGGVGYSYFFGSDSGKSASDQSKGSSKSSSSGDSGSSDESSSKGGSSGEESKGENSQVKNNAVSFRTLHEDADNLKWQIAELTKRVDHLGEQLDRRSQQKDETPPALHTMQIQMES